ncbi:MAG TPA: DUF3014 domain-containing protein [Casimicrobiaceae bacterium]
MQHVEPLDRDPDFERPIDPRRKATTRRRNFLWPILMVAAVVAAGFLVWRGMHAPAPVTLPPPQAAAPQPTAPPSNGPKYPIEAATEAPAQPTAPLPAVEESDTALQDAMAALFTAVPLDRVFHLQQIVPRFVATIDNLPRQTAALQKMPVNPVGGSVAIAHNDGRILLRADNATRYATYIRVMEQADTRKLVQTYVRFYPLFQKAYEDLGYPHGYFNDRLVEVIDHLLATPDVPAPIELVQPKVLYEFADPALEQRSAGQKIMIRMGPVNESRVKAKLRDIRQALTGQQLPRQ